MHYKTFDEVIEWKKVHCFLAFVFGRHRGWGKDLIHWSWGKEGGFDLKQQKFSNFFSPENSKKIQKWVSPTYWSFSQHYTNNFGKKTSRSSSPRFSTRVHQCSEKCLSRKLLVLLYLLLLFNKHFKQILIFYC